MSYYSDKHYKPRNDFDKFYYEMFFTKGDKILDIGCSTGNFAAQDHKNIVGIDIDKDAIKIAKRRGFNVIEQKNPEKLPFNNESIDNINCRHVIEHSSNPLNFMKEMRRVLKKNGRLVLLTDKPSRHFLDDYTHVRPFTKKSLSQLTYDAGFRKYKIYDFSLKGVFGIGFLYKKNIISSKFAKKAYLLYAKFLGGEGLLLETIK